MPKIAILSAATAPAREALKTLEQRYETVSADEADVVVALGGDGFMLEMLHKFMDRGTPIFGMNQGTVGFLMNAYREDDLRNRLARAQKSTIRPLRMKAETVSGEVILGLAINEVSLLRETRYAAKIKVIVDDRMRLSELICDGVMVATPAGSTAYNLSAHGPILPLGSHLLALTPICAFRPRRWRGALLSETTHVRFEITDPKVRPVSATADYTEVREVASVEVRQDLEHELHLLFDPEHNLEERIVSEQFQP